MSRVEFIKKLLLGSVSLFGISTFTTYCDKKEDKESLQKNNADPCNDLSGLSKDDIEMRNALEYVPNTPDKNKTCLNCEYYHPTPKENKNICGTCDLFPGPVNANGYCNQWYIKSA
jgi:hypothetical protein